MTQGRVTQRCVTCGEPLDPDKLRKLSRPRAACVCTKCVKASMTPEELNRLLHPQEADR